MYTLIFLSQAQKDLKKLSSSKLKVKTQHVLDIIKEHPFQHPPAFEFLKGDMEGLVSRRINKQHRIVYEVFEDQKIVKIYRLWTHYE